MPDHYWAVRPVSMPEHIRIEKAYTPHLACQLAFGRGTTGFEYKDLGTRVEVIRSDRRRIALLQQAGGWHPFRT